MFVTPKSNKNLFIKMNKELNISCSNCALPIVLNEIKYLINRQLYSGKCNNSECNKEQFACKLCYNYTLNNPIPSNRGRPVGVFTNIKTAKKHGKSDTHIIALKEYNDDLLKEQLIIDKNLNNTTTLEFDTIIESINEPIDQSNIDITNIEPIDQSNIDITNKNVGFHPKSKSPNYYSNEIKEKGNDAKYLLGKTFELKDNDFTEISNEEVNYFMKLSLLLTQITQQQQLLLAEILLLTSTSKDKDLNIFKNTRVPTSVKDFEDIFLSKSNAIIPNLPHQVISVTYTGGHAYIHRGR